MKTSQNGLDFIASWEGEIDHVYKDIAGVPTIGIGHALKAGESFPDGINHVQALALLAQDVGTAEQAIGEYITYRVSQNMFDALTSFAFNCGTGALENSTVRVKLNAGDVQGAADALLLWCKAVINGVLTTDSGLYKRRVAERQLFLTPDGSTRLTIPVPASPPPVPAAHVPHPAPDMSNVPVARQALQFGEQPADRIIRIVKSYVGCSLSNRRVDLGNLVSRGVDNPESVVTISTNCATSALGVMAAAGVEDSTLNKPYVSGMAISWLRQIGINRGALVTFKPGQMPKRGALMRYNTKGTNDDHVEWCLSNVDSSGSCDHGGGGRANNAITEGTGNILSSLGRPLVEWWDPDKLGIPVLQQDTPTAVPPAPAPVPVPAPKPPSGTPAPVQGNVLQSVLAVIGRLIQFLLKPRT